MASAAPEISVLARDQEFEALYRRYVTDVYHYALALLRNSADAEDVTQTTFMNAYRAFRGGIAVEKPQNWLIKIAHNVARTRYTRATRRVREVPLEDHVERLAVPESERPNVEGVLRELGRLPFNQRAALVMRELEGRSYVEIADTLGVSVAAVETLIFRARRSMRVRASALKSLGAVPLPASLTQLFEGGGIVVGGGALASSGFLIKAAVALVTGLLATGLGGDHSKQASAARGGRLPVGQALPPPGATAAGTFANALLSTQRAASTHVVGESAQPTIELPPTEERGGQTPVVVASSGTSASAAPTGPIAGAAPQAVTQPVTTSATNLVTTVQQTAPAAPVSLPLQPPPVPALPAPPALPVPPLPLPLPLPSPPPLPLP